MPKEDYVPASHKYNEEVSKKEETEKKKTVATPIEGKPSVSSRFKETFFGDSFENVKEYVIWDIMMPALKDFLYNLPQAVLGALFYGENSPSSYRPVSRMSNNTNYSRYSDERASTRRRETVSSKTSRRYDFDRYEFSTRVEAQDVLYEMIGEIEEHGQCSVADFYEMIGKDSQAEWIDQKWCWTDLKRVRIVPRHGHYVIDLPEPDTYIK